MRHSQRGITFIGWLFLLVPVAIVVYAGIRLTPIYLNYMRVAKSLTGLASEAEERRTTSAADAARFARQAASRSTASSIRPQGHRYPPRGRSLGGDRRLRGCGAAVRQSVAAGAVPQRGRAAVEPQSAMERSERLRCWLREALGYEPRDLALFETALTHRSAGAPNNERLEFLGDAVLGLITAQYLFERFGEADEGSLEPPARQRRQRRLAGAAGGGARARASCWCSGPGSSRPAAFAANRFWPMHSRRCAARCIWTAV